MKKKTQVIQASSWNYGKLSVTLDSVFLTVCTGRIYVRRLRRADLGQALRRRKGKPNPLIRTECRDVLDGPAWAPRSYSLQATSTTVSVGCVRFAGSSAKILRQWALRKKVGNATR